MINKIKSYWGELLFIVKHSVSFCSTLALIFDVFIFHLCNGAGLRRGESSERRRYLFMFENQRFTVEARPTSGDMFVLFEILKDQIYYLPTRLLADVHVVVDLGANIGMSAIYFSHRIPSVRIVCVEPDEGNLSVLRANVSALHCSVQVLEGAVSHSDGEALFMSGETWGGALVETGRFSDRCLCAKKVKCISMEQIMNDAKIERIDLLKIDIEGGELGLFSRPGEWLKKVSMILIELHHPYSLKMFLNDMNLAGFDVFLPGSEYQNKSILALNKAMAKRWH